MLDGVAMAMLKLYPAACNIRVVDSVNKTSLYWANFDSLQAVAPRLLMCEMHGGLSDISNLDHTPVVIACARGLGDDAMAMLELNDSACTERIIDSHEVLVLHVPSTPDPVTTPRKSVRAPLHRSGTNASSAVVVGDSNQINQSEPHSCAVLLKSATHTTLASLTCMVWFAAVCWETHGRKVLQDCHSAFHWPCDSCAAEGGRSLCVCGHSV